MDSYSAISSSVSFFTLSYTPGTKIFPLASTSEFIKAMRSAMASWLKLTQQLMHTDLKDFKKNEEAKMDV